MTATTEAIRKLASNRRYGPATLARWLGLGAADRAGLLALAEMLRPSENQLRDLWEWAEEIAQRERQSLAAVLAHPSVQTAGRRAVGRNDKLRLIRAALRRLRFPTLAAAEARARDLIHHLGLPASVRITIPEAFEGDELRVEIVARSSTELRAAVTSLQHAAGSSTCEQLFAVLGEPL
jgi:hypothetical protein